MTTPVLRNELVELDRAEQGDVDRFFGAARGSAPSPPGDTPKGIAPETLALVRETLVAAGGSGLSATECSERTGLARVSARRYLVQLVTAGESRRPAAVRDSGTAGTALLDARAP